MITTDTARSDMERRLWLLELTGADLVLAIECERWVCEGGYFEDSRVAESVEGREPGGEGTDVAPVDPPSDRPEFKASRAGAADAPAPFPTASASPPPPEHESGVVPGTDIDLTIPDFLRR